MSEDIVGVEQVDREAAWPLRPEGYGDTDFIAWMRGDYDGNRQIQAFARHRIAATLTPEPSAAVDLEGVCDFPKGARFTLHDEPGEHDPCYVVLPDGASLPLNHHDTSGVDIARAKFIIAACNSALDAPTGLRAADLTPKEWAVVAALGQELDLSSRAVLRQALSAYQSGHERRKAGETEHWSGDDQRARDFAGPLAHTNRGEVERLREDDLAIEDRAYAKLEKHFRSCAHIARHTLECNADDVRKLEESADFVARYRKECGQC